ncbi:MAG: asparagine synthase (glutamine-hydrolyzing) [Elusimicrobiota bacterium]
MCGIVGVLGLGRELGPGDAADAERMLDALAHRGPDGRDLFVGAGRRCLLGNTRLSVIDLSDAAALPMVNEDRSVALAYNGETTNFRELKTEFRLEERRPFRSSSDAETVLRLYESQGIAAAERLNGMFAFCLFDEKKDKAYLVRDPFGLRPLFYSVRNGRLYFASEIKSFLELPGFDAKLDAEGLFDYFTLAYIPGTKTPFESVTELDGGHFLEVDLARGTVRDHEYHRLRYEADPALDEGEAVRLTRRALESAVDRNMLADAPVGLTLSGGVDTSGLLALARRSAPDRELHTYSIRMSEPSFDETRYQRIMVEEARSIHHEVMVGPQDVLDHLEEHIAYMGEPSGDGGNLPFYLLAREAGRHVKVLLSGEGGDEVFNAYETHRAYKMRSLYRRLVPGPLRRAVRGGARLLPSSYSKLSFDFLLKRFTEGAEMGVPEAHLYWRHALTDAEKYRLLPGMRGLRTTGARFAEAYDRLDFPDGLDRLSWLDIRYYFIGDLMVKNDRMLMAHSVEGRYPYMDREVVALAARIDPSLRLKGLEGRSIQKKALEGLVPPEILRRTNMGLEMPHSLWFLKEFRPIAERYFSKANVEKSGLLDHAEVSRLWREHLERRKDNGRGLWCLLNFLVWFDLFVGERSYKRRLRPVRARSGAS